MPFTTGTSTHHNDLLADLQTYLTGLASPWTNEQYTPGALATDVATWSVRGPGSGPNGRVYINVETENDVGNGFYGWKIYGATSYVASTPFGSMPGAGGPIYFNLWQNSINYWFYANDRRFIVVAKVGTNYMSLYCGFFLPHALDTEYPYPLAIIGSYDSLQAPDIANAANSMISDPGSGAAWYRQRTTESWVQIKNQNKVTAAIDPAQGTRGLIWPHKTGQTSGIFQDDPDWWNSGGMDNMKTNATGESVMVQCHLMEVKNGGGRLEGALDGVYSTTGFGRTTEQVLVNGGQNYRLFQRAFRNTPADYFAIEEV